MQDALSSAGHPPPPKACAPPPKRAISISRSRRPHLTAPSTAVCALVAPCCASCLVHACGVPGTASYMAVLDAATCHGRDPQGRPCTGRTGQGAWATSCWQSRQQAWQSRQQTSQRCTHCNLGGTEELTWGSCASLIHQAASQRVRSAGASNNCTITIHTVYIRSTRQHSLQAPAGSPSGQTHHSRGAGTRHALLPPQPMPAHQIWHWLDVERAGDPPLLPELLNRSLAACKVPATTKPRDGTKGDQQEALQSSAQKQSNAGQKTRCKPCRPNNSLPCL